MDKSILDMIKKVPIINLLIGIVLSILVQFLIKDYGIFVFIGIVVAIINFCINILLGQLLFKKFRNSVASLYILNFILRIVIAAAIGYIIFKYNKYNVAAYLFGYTSHLFGVYIYSVIENK
ncbi:ATP synthase subunit I [Clostridium thailandense]|uniref:ATP synthase subunit I n=1 Tax=Clostridium thailandense TaxID=2794346 RepID=UPI00398A3CA9